MTDNIEDTKLQQIEQRANVAIFEYLKELCSPPNIIKETTFDETRDSAIEYAKQKSTIKSFLTKKRNTQKRLSK